jgi:hypothetical protein
VTARQRIRNDTGRPDLGDFEPPPLVPPFPIFHWSPSTRRKQIERYGFRVGMWSVDRAWKPPCTCWAPDPQLAWWLSGRNHPEVDSWDLWQTWSDVPSGMEALIDCRRDNGVHYVKEYRVYERIFKRDIWLVATRSSSS